MKLPRRSLIAGVAIVAAALALFFAFRRREAPARYAATPAERGDVVDVVGATGALQAVTTVQVGSQVSGTIETLAVDFNDHVKKGQVIARLDPSLFQARLGQMQANLAAAQANVERARSTVEDAKQRFERAKALSAENLLPAADLETAKANHDGAVAALKAAVASVTQARASVNQSEVDLGHTVIRAPIDGVVIARNVDVGQTVAASLQAPTLFVIANDLTQMQVSASIDEADIGRVRAGQAVTFRVDSYPDREFEGRVDQVRLQPTVVQNVVTYNAIISAANPGQRLMPGMTATVSVIVRKAEGALRIPASALRFRPEGYQAQRPGQDGAPAPGAAPAATGPPGADAGTARAAGPDGDSSGRRQWRGRRGDGEGRRGDGGGRPDRGAGTPEGGPGPARPGLVFVLDQKGVPQPTPVRIGISDGQYVEVREGLNEGARVVTGSEGAGARGGQRPGASPGANPFQPPQFQRRQR
jgi:HlyD family secretion protein